MRPPQRGNDKLPPLIFRAAWHNLKILIVDDHGLVREGLMAILGRSGLAASYLEAWDVPSVRLCLEQHPDLDLILLDIQLPDCNGLDLLENILAQRPSLPIIMLSAEYDGHTVRQAIDRGASGFLPKSTLNQVLVPAIQFVIGGGVYIPPEVLRAEPEPVAQAGAALVSPPFTNRQMDVFQLLLKGMSNKEISRQLDLAEATVKVHVRGILRTLNVSSRSEAIAKAVQSGWEKWADAPAGAAPAAAGRPSLL